MSRQQTKTIGVSVPRTGSRSRLQGRARFAADLSIQGMVYATLLRSDRSHAAVERVDPWAALERPGCLGVLTARDIPGRNRFGIINKDQPLLAEEKVRYLGEPIALIVAESPEVAESARDDIVIRYRDLPAVFDPEDALREGAPLVHETGNLLSRRVIKKGRPESAFARADVIVEQVYSTSWVEHTYLEPDAGVAFRDESGRIVLYASTQNPHYDQKDIAALLGVDEDQVRVVQCATGGGFGSKLDLNVQGFLALAVHSMARPVKMVYEREEAYLGTSKRHPLRIAYKSAASSDGRLLAVDVRIMGDTGAYASYGMAVCSRAAVHATGPYEIPNVSVESVMAYTNNPVAGAMRGFGVPQIAFAHESQMDVLARKLGMSPLEIRERNCLRVGALTATGQEMSASVGIRDCISAVTPYWEQGRKEARACTDGLLRGRGVGAMFYGIGNTGVQNPSTAQIELQRDGTITLYTGAADIGQGSCTVLRQMCAEVLGMEPQDIRLVVADTLTTTNAGATSASRQTYISGNAVLDATRKLLGVLLTEAAMILKTDKRTLIPIGGKIAIAENLQCAVSFADIAARAHHTGLPPKWQGYFDPETTPLDEATGQGAPYATYAYACHLAEVAVDTVTGEVFVERVVAAHDVGCAINPENVRGQILSGVAMGMGYALMEEYIPGISHSMKDYHIPTAADMPLVVPIIIEDPEPTGPFGAKGVGEPALIPTAPAIVNAICDALGRRLVDMPANLERVRKAGAAFEAC